MCVCLQTHVFLGARGEHHISSIPHYPIFYSFCVWTHICAREYMHDCKCVPHTWRSEDNLQESVHSFYHVSSGDWTKVIRFGHKHFKLLSHLASSTAFFEMVFQWAWSFLIPLDWLASEPPESSCLSLPGIAVVTAIPSFGCPHSVPYAWHKHLIHWVISPVP